MSMNAAAIQRSQGQSEKYSTPSVNSLIYEDLPLSELSVEMRERIADFRFSSWFGSLSFCESYAHPSVQNLAFSANTSAEIQEVVFFNERKWAGLFKEMEVVGPIHPEAELLLKLRTKHQPDLIRFSLQSSSTFPEKMGEWMLVEVRRINEDYCIPLGATPEEYLERLGKQTRKHLPYYLRRLRREYQESLVIRTATGAQISMQSFIDLLELNQLRMRSKGKETLWTRETALHRWPLFQKSGLLVSLHIGDELVGGSLSVLHCNEAFLVLIAHDPQFNRFNIGNICLWQTIEHLIGVGCSAFHLLWGQSFYKTQFGGSLKPIYQISYALNSRATAAWRLYRLLKIEEAASLAQRIRLRAARYGAFERDLFHSLNGSR